MIKKTISREFNLKEVSANSVREEMKREAIKDDGIFSTFRFDTKWLTTSFLTKVTLQYCKFDGDGCCWIPIQKKILYKTYPELGDVRLPYVGTGSLEKVADRIKLDVAKNDNAIWSTIKVQPWTDHFTVSYDRAYVDKPMTAQEIENTKKTLRRLEWLKRNAVYALYPFTSTCAFDEKSKEDSKALFDIWKAKAEAIEKEGRWKSWEPALKYAEADAKATKEAFEFKNGYYLKSNKEEKEKKDMNVTLMVVPEGMSETFVRKVKANYQSNNSLRLFIASTDIDYSCEHEPIKTKYDLFEKWIKTGYVDVVYFMLGFEKDPDVRAFESFVRGITEFSGKVDVRVAYQRDDILNDANNLRTAYFDEADSKEDLENAANKVVKEAKTMQDIYGLDDEGLEAIKYSKGRIEISEGLIMDKIMDVAFAEDEDAKPKKGGKK